MRWADDYLVFCKNKDEPNIILQNIIQPKLNELGLEINEKRLSSGRFHRDRVSFIGFDFYSGHFQIAEAKLEEFKKRIIKITHLTKKSPPQAIIKQLNNKILGFAHYYKFTSGKQDFEKLDALIRQRLRRWLLKNKDQKQKIGNLYLTNANLKNLGLKSLTDVLVKYTSKKRVIFLKSEKKKLKTVNRSIVAGSSNISASIDGIRYYSILKEISQIAKRLSRIERSIAKIAKKMTNS